MAGSIAKLVVSLGANITDFETDMKRASKLSKKELEKMERQAKRLNDEWNRNFRIAGAAVASGLAVATKAAVDFEKAMAEVATLGTGNIEELGDSVKQLAVEFGQAPTEQARALYQIISAGASDSATQLEQLTAANKLAVGGITSVANAADGLTTVLNAYEGSGLTAQNVSDILFATMKGGKTTIDELSSSVGQVATIASQTGVSFAELGATVATLTKSGLNTSEAMTSLRSVLSAVLTQTAQTKTAADEIGISFDVAALKSKGLFGVLQDIANSGASEEQLAKLVGRVEGLTAVLSATREGGRVFNDLLSQIANSAGITEQALAEMTGTASYQLDRLKSAIQVFGIDIGSKLLPGIASFAEAVVANMGKVRAIVESVAAFIITRVGIGMVAAFAGAAAAAKSLATAMAFIGGPIGLAATAVALLVVNWDRLLEQENALGGLVRFLNEQFTTLKTIITGLAGEIANLAQIGANAFEFLAAKVDVTRARIAAVGEAAAALASGGVRAAADAFAAGMTGVEEAAARADKALADMKKNVGDIGKAWADAAQDGADAAEELDDAISDVVETAEALPSAVNKSSAALSGFAANAKKAEDRLKGISKTLGEAFAILDITVAQDPFRELAKGIGGFVDEVINGVDPLADMKKEAEGLVAALNPGRTAAEQFSRQLTLLRDYADATGRSAEWLAQQELLLAESFAEANRQIFGQTDGLDLLKVAIDEGARIMERIFQDMFSGIVDDGQAAFDSLLNGFEQMIGRMNSEAARGIQLEFQAAFGEGGGGFGSVDWRSVGLNFGQIAASAFADDIVTGIFGDQNYGTDYVEIGKQIGTVVGAIVGSFIPVIGTALGAIIGAFSGALHGLVFGKLFGREFGAVLGGEVVAEIHGAAPDAQVLKTPLANVVGISGQGGFGDLNDPETPGGKIGEAIRTFDTAVFDILKAMDAGAEFEQIVSALENWKGALDGGANDIEALLRGRMSAIVGTLGQHAADFVGVAEDIEGQIERFGVALAVDKLFESAPDALAGRTQAEFLAIIEDYRDGLQSIGEAAEEVIGVFQQVVGITDFLKGFASSNPAQDFQAILDAQSRTTEEALAGISSQLFDAIANFDGSLESLQEIAGLAAAVREGEIALLQQIDDIQKGLNSSLDKLKNDILGISEQPQSITETLFGAEAFIRQLGGAQSAADVAAIGQQFEALIRGLDQEQMALAGNDLVTLIDLFQQTANQRLETIRQNTLDNAASVRDVVDTFLSEIGDPLDIIAASLDGANLNETMDEGLENINQSVQQIGPQVAGALSAVFGDGITVNVTISDSGLVTQ